MGFFHKKRFCLQSQIICSDWSVATVMLFFLSSNLIMLWSNNVDLNSCFCKNPFIVMQDPSPNDPVRVYFALTTSWMYIIMIIFCICIGIKTVSVYAYATLYIVSKQQHKQFMDLRLNFWYTFTNNRLKMLTSKRNREIPLLG